jgi:hypothetical protein
MDPPRSAPELADWQDSLTCVLLIFDDDERNISSAAWRTKTAPDLYLRAARGFAQAATTEAGAIMWILGNLDPRR